MKMVIKCNSYIWRGELDRGELPGLSLFESYFDRGKIDLFIWQTNDTWSWCGNEGKQYSLNILLPCNPAVSGIAYLDIWAMFLFTPVPIHSMIAVMNG